MSGRCYVVARGANTPGAVTVPVHFLNKFLTTIDRGVVPGDSPVGVVNSGGVLGE